MKSSGKKKRSVIGSAGALRGQMMAGRKGKTGWICEIYIVSTGQGLKKVKSDILGVLSLPTTVKNPPNDSSSGSTAFSDVKTPTSTFEEAPDFDISSFQVPSDGALCRNVVTTSACDMES